MFLWFRRNTTIGLKIAYPQLDISMGPIKIVKLSQTKIFGEKPVIPNIHIQFSPHGSAAVPDDHMFCMEII